MLGKTVFPGGLLIYLFLSASVCRNESYQELDQDYSGTKRTSALQQLHLPSTSDNVPVKASGTSLVPTNDHNLQVRQSVVDTETANLCHDIETTFKDLTPVSASPPSMATTFLQTISEPTLRSPQPLSIHASVLPKLGINSTSALASTSQSLTTPPLKIHTLRPPALTLSSEFVTVPAALSTSASDSSQMTQGSKAFSSATSTSPVTIFQSQSLASPSQTSTVRHLALPPIIDNQDSRGLQVTKSPLSQIAQLPALPRPSFPIAPTPRALVPPPKFQSLQPNFLTDTDDDNSIISAFPASIAVTSTNTFTASVSSQKLVSAQQFSESSLLITDTNVVLSSCQGTGHAASHESEQQTSDIPCSPMKTNSVSDVNLTHQKVNVISSVCKREGNADLPNEDLDIISDSSLSIPCTKETEKDLLPVVKKDLCTSKDQAASGRENDSTLNYIWDTESKNFISLPGIIYRSEAVECCEHTQDEGSSMFEVGSINKNLGDVMPESDQTDDPSSKNDAVDLSTKIVNDATPLKDHSQIHNYIDNTPQTNTSQHISSLNDSSDKFNKGKTV